jgi:hypothetical protein
VLKPLHFTAVLVAILSLINMQLVSILKKIPIKKGHFFRGSQTSGIDTKRLKFSLLSRNSCYAEGQGKKIGICWQ